MSDVTSRTWWRWESMIGALVTDYGAGVRICGVTKDYLHGAAVETPTNNHGPVWMRLRKERCTAVDETDPATLGCLTQRARDLHNDPTISTVCRRRLRIPGDPASGWDDGPWSAVATSYSVTIEIATGPTEFAALLAACDAAPVNTKEGP